MVSRGDGLGLNRLYGRDRGANDGYLERLNNPETGFSRGAGASAAGRCGWCWVHPPAKRVNKAGPYTDTTAPSLIATKGAVARHKKKSTQRLCEARADVVPRSSRMCEVRLPDAHAPPRDSATSVARRPPRPVDERGRGPLRTGTRRARASSGAGVSVDSPSRRGHTRRHP